MTNSIPGLGTVTSVATGTGLTGGTITSTGTISMSSTIAAAGPKGSATVAPIITYNAQGQLTTVTTATIAPAVGSVTGLGTGVATALGVNVGTAGAPVVNGGALGTPSGGTATNLTGTATGLTAGTVTTNANLTGAIVTSTGNATTVNTSPITNSLSGDVSLANTALYYDGPSVAQGTSGTWFVSGTITVSTAAIANVFAKLWDGTSVIATAAITTIAGNNTTISLSGYIASPVGNLRISARDSTAATGTIVFNGTGLSKDSTITAIRIA